MAKILKRLFGGRVDARACSFAGHMYPEGEDELRGLLSGALDSAEASEPWRAAMVPHSDLTLTAELQAPVWKSLPQAKKVLVVAPALRVPFRGVGVSSKEAFETPLGHLEIDHDDYRPLEGSSVVRMQDEAHRVEPGIELQLPWIKHLAPSARLIPLLVGDGPAEDVARVLDRLWDADTVLVLACELSTDLSADEARTADADTVERIRTLDGSGFDFGDVSGRKPLAALLKLAKARGLSPRVGATTHTGELGGPTERVQGLAAITFG